MSARLKKLADVKPPEPEVIPPRVEEREKTTIRVFGANNKVLVELGQMLEFVVFSPEGAINFAELLLSQARAARVVRMRPEDYYQDEAPHERPEADGTAGE